MGFGFVRKLYEKLYKNWINCGVSLNVNPVIAFIHGNCFLTINCVLPLEELILNQIFIFMCSFSFLFVCLLASSLLIVYEGYEEEIKESSPMAEMTTTPETSNHAKNDGPEPVKPMEDDSHSHSGNCSYDADASNDSIELNLSLDEQQHHYQPVSFPSIV